MTGRDSELRRYSFLRVSDRCPAVDRRSIRNSSDPGEIVDFNTTAIDQPLTPHASNMITFDCVRLLRHTCVFPVGGIQVGSDNQIRSRICIRRIQ